MDCWLTQIAFMLSLSMCFLSSPQIQVSGFGAEFLCARMPGLTVKQREICQNAPDSLPAIGDGTQLGLAECQEQFRHHRWNCSTISTTVGHIAVVGSREAAFLYAISSAGVTYAIAQACARGNISSCGCSPPTTISTLASKFTSTALGNSQPNANSSNASETGNRNRVFHEWNTITGWRWGGCSTDIMFATKLARIFLDSREVEKDARSFMNLHNNKAGRKAVQNTLETQCKCHGLSGSCTLKTCWLKLTSFRNIGNLLMEKYQSAQYVYATKSKVTARSEEITTKRRRKKRMQLYIRTKSHRIKKLEASSKSSSSRFRFRRMHKDESFSSDSNKEFARLRSKMKRKVQRRRRPKLTDLAYLEESPNYCEPDSLKGVIGTRSRSCKRSSSRTQDHVQEEIDDGSCEILCCGRGYSTYEILKRWKCQCKFTWCCTVECKECEQLVETYTCN